MPAITFYERMIAIRSVNDHYNETCYTGSEDGTTADTLVTPIDLDTEEADGVASLKARTQDYIACRLVTITDQLLTEFIGIGDDEYMVYVSALAELKTFSDFYKSL